MENAKIRKRYFSSHDQSLVLQRLLFFPVIVWNKQIPFCHTSVQLQITEDIKFRLSTPDKHAS